LDVLRGLKIEHELADLQRRIDAKPPIEEVVKLGTRRLELQKQRKTLARQ
jgi:hypothetical protein